MKIYVCCKNSACLPADTQNKLEILDWTEHGSKKCVKKIRELKQENFYHGNTECIVQISEKAFKRFPSRYKQFRTKKDKKDIFEKITKNAYCIVSGRALFDEDLKSE